MLFGDYIITELRTLFQEKLSRKGGVILEKSERIALNKRRYAVYAQYRDKCGFTDYYISQECGIPKSSIYDWGNGISFPNAEKLLKICKLLNMPIEEVVNG